MIGDELLAMTEQGPAVVMSSREDMVRLLTERRWLAEEVDRLRADNRLLALWLVLMSSLTLWYALFTLLKGVL